MNKIFGWVRIKSLTVLFYICIGAIYQIPVSNKYNFLNCQISSNRNYSVKILCSLARCQLVHFLALGATTVILVHSSYTLTDARFEAYDLGLNIMLHIRIYSCWWGCTELG